MIYLMTTIVSNVVMVFVMKHSETHSGNRYATTLFNYMVGAVITYVLMEDKALYHAGKEGCFAVELAVFNALCMTSCMLLNQYSINRNGAPLSTTFNRLGILIPTVLSMVFFRELPAPVQMIGIGLAVLAIVYINGGKKKGGPIQSLPSLLLVFLIGGLIDFNSKVYGIFGDRALQDYFVFCTFAFCTVLSGILLFLRNPRFKRKDVTAGLLMGIPNQMITYTMVRAVLYLPAYLAFPLYSAGVILGVNVINFLVFREKPSRRECIATGIIAAALLLLNL